LRPFARDERVLAGTGLRPLSTPYRRRRWAESNRRWPWLPTATATAQPNLAE